MEMQWKKVSLSCESDVYEAIQGILISKTNKFIELVEKSNAAICYRTYPIESSLEIGRIYDTDFFYLDNPKVLTSTVFYVYSSDFSKAYWGIRIQEDLFLGKISDNIFTGSNNAGSHIEIDYELIPCRNPYEGFGKVSNQGGVKKYKIIKHKSYWKIFDIQENIYLEPVPKSRKISQGPIVNNFSRFQEDSIGVFLVSRVRIA